MASKSLLRLATHTGRAPEALPALAASSVNAAARQYTAILPDSKQATAVPPGPESSPTPYEPARGTGLVDVELGHVSFVAVAAEQKAPAPNFEAFKRNETQVLLELNSMFTRLEPYVNRYQALPVAGLSDDQNFVRDYVIAVGELETDLRDLILAWSCKVGSLNRKEHANANWLCMIQLLGYLRSNLRDVERSVHLLTSLTAPALHALLSTLFSKEISRPGYARIVLAGLLPGMVTTLLFESQLGAFSALTWGVETASTAGAAAGAAPLALAAGGALLALVVAGGCAYFMYRREKRAQLDEGGCLHRVDVPKELQTRRYLALVKNLRENLLEQERQAIQDGRGVPAAPEFNPPRLQAMLEAECSSCLEELDVGDPSVVFLNASHDCISHPMHEACARELMQHHVNCPSCQKAFTEFKPVYESQA
eukprot:gb/GEZN01007101.1/.p1 GENE.gb/GEZN01007101.1/~~gb/GEZN01007101.1/.p1  ORF type:complete len:437 (+),score=65.61 gb/GEZN01007101.1/:40-1311(+)